MGHKVLYFQKKIKVNVIFRILLKIIITLLIIIIYSSIFNGCVSGARTNIGRGFGLFLGIIILAGSIYGVWSYQSRKKDKVDALDISLKK